MRNSVFQFYIQRRSIGPWSARRWVEVEELDEAKGGGYIGSNLKIQKCASGHDFILKMQTLVPLVLAALCTLGVFSLIAPRINFNASLDFLQATPPIGAGPCCSTCASCS